MSRAKEEQREENDGAHLQPDDLDLHHLQLHRLQLGLRRHVRERAGATAVSPRCCRIGVHAHGLVLSKTVAGPIHSGGHGGLVVILIAVVVVVIDVQVVVEHPGELVGVGVVGVLRLDEARDGEGGGGGGGVWDGGAGGGADAAGAKAGEEGRAGVG